MVPIATLGTAFVNVRADTDKFPDDVRRAMRRLNEDLRQDTDRAGDEIGQRLGQRISEGLSGAVRDRRVEVDIDPELSPTSAARTEAALRVLARDREVNIRINRRRLGNVLRNTSQFIGSFILGVVRIFGDFFNFGRQIGQIFGEAFGNLSRAMGGAANASVSLGAALAQVAAAFVALSLVITILIGILGVLLAIVIPLIQTLQLFLTILPGLAVGLLFAFVPLILIFTNLGDAIKATTGSAEEFGEAIEGLGDNTGAVLTSLRGLIQFFLEIREEMQESFFEPINEALQNLNNNLGPVFEEGFMRVAGAAGDFAAAFIEMFDHPMAIPFFDALFGIAELGFEEIGGAVLELIGAFANLIDESIPNVRRGIDGIARTIEGWADSLNNFADSPDFQDTLMSWEDAFARIRDLTDEIVRLAGNLISGFEEDGIPVLERVIGIFESLNEFLESDMGEQFFDGLRIAANALLFVVVLVGITIGGWITLLGIAEEIVSGDFKDGIEDLNELGGVFSGTLVTILDTLLNSEDVWEEIRLLVSLTGGPLGLGLLAMLAEDWEQTLEDIRGIWQGIRDRAQRVADFVNRLLDTIRGTRGPLGTVRSLFSSMSTFATRIRDRFNSARAHLRNILSPIRGVRDAAITIASRAGSFRSALSSALSFVRQIRDTARNIVFPRLPFGLGNLFRQEGGIFTRATPAIIGEAGAEVLIPLTRPQRARELIAASGLGNMIRGGDGASISAPGGGGALQVIFQTDGSAASDALVELLRRGVRVRGGNVQAVVGSGNGG